MKKSAFFFCDNSLLQPADFSGLPPAQGFPFDLAEDFNNPDIFEIPSLNGFGTLINVVSIPSGYTLSEKWKAVPVRHFLSMYAAEYQADCNNSTIASDKIISDILRACHVAQWRKESRFCGTCGAKNNDVPAQVQRVCPDCGRLEFPRICPASIVAITNSENKILLAHNIRFRAGVYSLIAGYNEAGESFEETVAREVREEVNIEVKDIKYFKSQPWPFPNSIMVGFKAKYAGGTLKPDNEEIEDAGWYTKDNLPELPGEGSLARVLINDWLNNN